MGYYKCVISAVKFMISIFNVQNRNIFLEYKADIMKIKYTDKLNHEMLHCLFSLSHC
ncbi:hypothetical protein GLOIN_2v1598706 [Rhizophagus irregularis DAOM 181602=DAOM 197198]|uniref:Uncharacterized protein n=1 Tax=Rhizophagus irregularis (strain DAOM 181602 / DAOM 197198 / MUCL 43194) TaxID=747089 RepID=A0A2P4Q3F9_RHIID|nr:hypothetical protein GLOIN_2v1598706 [Rhizophagus irregularis DAOM 181602=DAOM 197198]POG72146.1 hypothetical protein GLOIN_2v1598706 [Rhizophagus irregularis DAOM 181602=DAOM 197198]|eukprot:XP_025179012.1 hypothetical protein GLOIN_2v1598706 [Rhizophagus irregularis DAOM 181602=DAOM 197198]